MSTISLSDVEVTFEGRRLGPFNQDHEGCHMLLLGEWRWLRAHLSGALPLTRGAVHCLGDEGRGATIRGRVGISLVGISPPPFWEVATWIERNLEFFGESRGSARQRTARLLSDLGLRAMARNKVSELNPAEAFAAHAAFAASTGPELLVLGAPLLIPETRVFELRLLKRLKEGFRIAMACERFDESLLEFADEVAYAGSQRGTSGRIPLALMAPPSPCYRIRPLGTATEWIGLLSERGARLKGPSDQGEWTVTLPEGATCDVIVEALVASGEGLAELVSLSEAR